MHHQILLATMMTNTRKCFNVEFLLVNKNIILTSWRKIIYRFPVMAFYLQANPSKYLFRHDMNMTRNKCSKPATVLVSFIEVCYELEN